MKSTIQAGNTRAHAHTQAQAHAGHIAFSTLVFLMMLALMGAVGGSYGYADAGSADDDTEGENSAQARTSGAEARQPIVPLPSATATPTTTSKIAFRRQSGSVDELWLMNDDGSDQTQLTPAGRNWQPKWSPDGTKIAYLFDVSGLQDIYVMNADGTNQHPVTSGPGYDALPSWSPDGTGIAFVRNSDVYTVNVNTGIVMRLTTDGSSAFNSDPTWSPDGTKIAFTNTYRDGDYETEIYIMNADATDQHVLADPPADISYYYLTWSPDGSRIAFTRWPILCCSDARIYTVNADGSNIMQISYGSPEEADLYPTWSPDGTRIAFVRPDLQNLNQIYVVDADGSGAHEHNISNNTYNNLDPDWQRKPRQVVLVQREDGQPVAGAQVYTNTRGPGFPSTFVGTTNMSGTLPLPDPHLNEYIIARSLVYTGTTQKAAHDGWAYHVWATNIVQQNDGLQSAYVITDTSLLTQTLIVTTTSPLIGFNIVTSVEYNATPSNLSIIAEGLSGKDRPNGSYYRGASDYLLDVTDGQMFFENVTVYEDKQHWDDADYQFFAYYPRADADLREDGRSALTGTCCHIHVQGSGDFGTAWNQQSAYSTLIHEFTHYAIGAYDEYFYQYDGDNANCSLVTEPDYDKRASIMANNRNSSEYCNADNHNPMTHQDVQRGESVWRTLQNNWDDDLSRWTLQSPLDRGFVDPGPNGYISREAQKPVTTIIPVADVACPPIRVYTLHQSLVDISLNHQGYSIYEGQTDWDSAIWVYGAEIGVDTIEARFPNVIGPGYYATGHADVTSCNAITITLSTTSSPLAPIQPGQSSPPAEPMPTYWITATANFSQTQVHPLLHFASDPPSPPSLYASQGGINRQQVPLTYDPVGHNYSGDFSFDPNRSLDFQLEVGLTGTHGLQVFPNTFIATQYHSSGPQGADKGRPPFTPPLVPSNWDIFPPETMVNLSVDTSSLPDSTGVMGGEVSLPAPPPNSLLAVGGPYSIEGENPISGTAHLSLEYQSEYFCGLQPGTTAIYRYNGTGWDALTTALNEEWHVADAAITQWGIYAVFAQTNPQAVFSDVPPGSTFYDYINWITCHGIASGYADGTFRPNNNATRGQISKMVANAFHWRLEAPQASQAQQKGTQGVAEPIQWQFNPTVGGYTFTDVPPGSTFFLYIEGAYREGVVSGYPCGGPGEPCDPNQRPYFRPGANVTRGQISKIIANAAHYNDTPTGQTFQDVAPGSTFYDYIERMASRGIINGYACGSPGQPCVPPGNRPYFRPGSNASRGQLSKMIYLALQPR